MNKVQQPRRHFLQIALASTLTALFNFPKSTYGKTILEKEKGVVIHEEDGLHILTGRRKVPMNIQMSKTKNGIDGMSFCSEDIIPGRKLRVHKHLYNDEFIFIQNGDGIVTLDEKHTIVKTGTVIFIPRGVWHGIENTGKETMRMVFGYTPAGFEQYFLDNGTPVGKTAKERTAEEYALAAKKYGMVYKTI